MLHNVRCQAVEVPEKAEVSLRGLVGRWHGSAWRADLLINAMHAVQGLEQPEVSIRRRPPEGLQHQPCGNQFQFEVHQTADNKPRNILEEIVWCASRTCTAPCCQAARCKTLLNPLVLCARLHLHSPWCPGEAHGMGKVSRSSSGP